ncbi:MAG: tRNA (adenosine(37)-N6)-threonylcarbamoyltransferase complex ATPase subunit type 1 TsaE [Maribacter sp.]
MQLEYTKNDLKKIAQKLIIKFTNKTVAFYGPIGAGKTTLIKAIVKELDGKEEVSSPTFGIVNEYEYKDGDLLGYHFDFYRLTDESEALDLGLEDYFNMSVWIFMEWPEKIINLLPTETTKLYIEIIGVNKRRITLGS